MKKPFRIIKKITFTVVGGWFLSLVLLNLLVRLFPFDKKTIRESFSEGSVLVLDKHGGEIGWRVDPAGRFFFPETIDNFSPWLFSATIAAEDKRFRKHSGVDFLALSRALFQNIFYRKRISGASTLTMQVIRLLRPRPRTYLNKMIEMFQALQLEHSSTKKEILELYFNLAPYGGNIVGAEAASRRYFGKKASELTLGEASLLAGIPQSPSRLNPRKHLPRALKRRTYVLQRMLHFGMATSQEIREISGQTLSLRPLAVGQNSHRFTDLAVQMFGRKGGVLQTTLDPQIQELLQNIFFEWSNDFRSKGIDGGGCVVVEVKNSSLAGLIGSLDPHDPQKGWVNGTTVRRSPGSLLKPFIYCRAFDSGFLTPGSLVYDIPTTWKDYKPQNIDRRFLGPIPAEKALFDSRNLPAVRILQTLGTEPVIGDLNSMDLHIECAEKISGLALALGTREVRLLDITNAYASLARLGEYRPLKILSEQNEALTRRIFSEGASYLTLRSLQTLEETKPFKPAFKTGTSWKHRDAWAVVMSPEFVVGIWLGTLSGRENLSLTGSSSALPVAMDIMEKILSFKPCESWKKPDNVKKRPVCSLSGAPRGLSCPQETLAEYLPGKSPSLPCRIHNLRRGDSLPQKFSFWPENVKPFFQDPGIPGSIQTRPRVKILSPMDGGEYLLPSLSKEQKAEMVLEVNTTMEQPTLFWFLDGELIAKTKNSSTLPCPMFSGRHELIVSDSSGTTDKIDFMISVF